MRLIVNVYLISLCGLLGSAAAGILDIPRNIFNNVIGTGKEQSNISTQANLDMLQIIRKAGYPAEAHTIQTEDGYLLTLYRISNRNGSPVLLQHGLLTCFADFLIPGKDKGLGVILNNPYEYLDRYHPSCFYRSNFFDSFHEMGVYDLPAMISYITDITSRPLYAYIGHSMGATASYVMAAERPEIVRMVRMMISLAPAAFLKHMKSPIRYLTPYAGNIQNFMRLLSDDEFLPHNTVMHYMNKLVCTKGKICTNLLFLLCGFDKEQFDMTLMPMIASYNPAGTSTKTLVHLAQEHNSGKFRQYDYGRAKNLQIYNAPEPPDYNLANITTPIALFYAQNDWLASTPDVKKLIGMLPNVVDEYEVPFPKFNHLDFLWAKNAPQLLYNRVLEVMKLESTPS